MKQVHKDYERPFLLEKTKLDRLMGVIHDRLGEHKGTTRRDDFEVFLSDHRREEMTSIDDVLTRDNSRKSKIQRLLIACCASTGGAARPDHEIQVDFDGRPSSKAAAVKVSVRSDDAGWCDRVLSEIEEQVERTSIQDTLHRVAGGVLGLFVLITLLYLVLSSLGAGNSRNTDADVMWLRSHDVDRVQQILKQDRTITDEEMREIATRQLRNVLADSGQTQSGGLTKQRIFLGVPLLVVLACLVFLGARCYPRAVFLWGDEVERYDSVLRTRRIVWSLIVSGIVFGVLANFLYTGLVSGP